MVYNFFDKKSKGRGINIEEKPNKELTEELHKPIIMKFKKRTVYLGFKGNVWDKDNNSWYAINKQVQ